MRNFCYLKEEREEGYREKRLGLYHDLLFCPGMGRALTGVEKLPGAEELFPSGTVTGPL